MPSLRIAVIGPGRIGTTFAFHLARNGGHDVTVVARPNSARLGQLERDGGILTAGGTRAEVRVTDTLDEAVAYDLILVTLLDHQVDAVLPALQRSQAGCIQFMINSFSPERLREAVGTERCAFGMPFIQANLDAAGRLNAKVGAGGQKSLMDRARWVEVFANAGLPAVLETNMLSWLRCHAPLCVAFESISFASVQRGRGAAWHEALRLAHGDRKSVV